MAFTDASARAALRQVFDAAIASADPSQVLARHLPERPSGRVIVLGAGKSAAVMAAAVETAWPDAPIEGLVVTRYAHGYPTRRVRVLEASHPVPDAAGARAAAELLEVARGAALGPVVESGRTLVDLNYENILAERWTLKVKVKNLTNEAVSYTQNNRTIELYEVGKSLNMSLTYQL